MRDLGSPARDRRHRWRARGALQDFEDYAVRRPEFFCDANWQRTPVLSERLCGYNSNE
jgi:hypothetical protein